jgi:hypothetical protein
VGVELWEELIVRDGPVVDCLVQQHQRTRHPWARTVIEEKRDVHLDRRKHRWNQARVKLLHNKIQENVAGKGPKSTIE